MISLSVESPSFQQCPTPGPLWDANDLASGQLLAEVILDGPGPVPHPGPCSGTDSPGKPASHRLLPGEGVAENSSESSQLPLGVRGGDTREGVTRGHKGNDARVGMCLDSYTMCLSLP